MGYPLHRFLKQVVLFKGLSCDLSSLTSLSANLEEVTGNLIVKFADDTKLEGAVTTPLTEI